MVLLHSDPVTLGTSAPDFTGLPGTDGRTYGLADFADADVLAVVFMCNHCPYVVGTIDRLVALQAEFADRGVRFVGINANDVQRYASDSPERMVDFAAKHGVNFPYVFDATQQVAKAYGAVCTPDIFVFDRERALRYRGRIDDNWRNPSAATQHDLQAALTALTEGRAVAKEQHPSMGCSIKWKPGNAPGY